MSRTSKNARNVARRKSNTLARKNGGGGPAKTAPKHGKTKAWWQKFPNYGAFVRGGKKQNAEA